MKTQPQSSHFTTRMLITLSLLIMFGCSQFASAQQRDGEASDSASTGASSGRVNFNIIQLMSGEYLEMFGTGSSRGLLRGHPSTPGVELSTTSPDPLIFSTNSTERMRILPNGFVGFGTGTPQDALHVFNTTNSVGTVRLQGGNTNAGFISFWDPGQMLLLANNRNPGTGVNFNSTVTGAQLSLWGGDIVFHTSSTGTVPTTTELMRINAANSVGTIRLQGGNTNAGFIGMWDPGQMLLIANNRHPGTAANYNSAAAGALMSLWGADVVFHASSSGPIGNITELVRIKGGGQVGIGTSAPGFKLDVQGGAINASGGLCMNGDCRTTWQSGIGSQWTTSGSDIFYNTGNVGIGATPTAVKLHVAGDGKFTGSLTVDGNIAAKYQDLAEWVPAATQLSVGTVVVLDTTTSNHVMSSNSSYDTRVAGVISEQPGIVLGEKSDNKVLVATTGRVRVKVDATNAPIQIGDLLVTSNREGFAMKSLPVEIGGARIHRPGTLIGKALEPLASGAGEILVLLSLQ
jgi:hypothetical protein